MDYFQPLHKDDPLLPSLEAEVVKRLDDRSHDHIAIAHPELYDADRLVAHKITYKRSSVPGQRRCTIDDIYVFLDDTGFHSVDPNEVYLVGIDDQEQAVTRRRPLYDYLRLRNPAYQSDFVLSLGQWFKIGQRLCPVCLRARCQD